MSPVLTLVVVLLISCTCVPAARIHRSGKTQEKAVGSGDGAADAARDALCEDEVVAETCALMQAAGGSGGQAVSKTELEEVLGATEASVDKLLTKVGISSDEIGCKELCTATVRTLPADRVPPSIEVGCRRGIRDLEEEPIVCDVDLSPSAIRDLAVSKTQDMADMHDHKLQTPKDANGEDVTEAVPDLTLLEMVRKVLNLYKIYPLLSFNKLDEPFAGENETDTQEGLETYEEPKEGASNLEVGNAGPKITVTVIPMADLKVGDKVKAHFIITGGKKSSVTDGATVDEVNEADASVKVKFDDGAEQQLPVEFIKEIIKDGVTYLPKKMVRKPLDPEIRKDIEKVSVQAQGYVSNVLRQIRAHNTKTSMDKWYGTAAFTNQATRTEITRLMSSLDVMLNNVDYVYPGPACADNTFGYVYPSGPFTQNAQDEYMFYLCPLYLRSAKSVQIETLTHEGSHHATAFTHDVCPDGRDDGCDFRAYGRSTCERLAREHPKAALKNADSLCYYINDVNGDFAR